VQPREPVLSTQSTKHFGLHAGDIQSLPTTNSFLDFSGIHPIAFSMTLVCFHSSALKPHHLEATSAWSWQPDGPTNDSGVQCAECQRQEAKSFTTCQKEDETGRL